VRDTLYIQVRDVTPDVPLTYALVGSQPGLGISAQHAPIDSILPLAAGRRVVLFVPGGDVRLTQVTVPVRQPQKILQAAPYALEDQLAEDVDTLHFALAPDASRRAANEPQPIAVVAKTRMESWLAPLKAKGITPDAVVPETLSLPLPEPGSWTAIAEGTDQGGRATVRSGMFAGFSCSLEDLGSYLQLADPDGKVPLRVFVSRNVEFDFTRLARPVDLMPGYGDSLEVLVRNHRPEQSIDLLQGAYSAREDWQRLARPWRVAGALALSWAVLAVANEGVENWRLGRELAQQEQRNLARYQAIFPSETRIVDLAAQAQQQMKALQGGAGRAPLFQLLDSLGAALASNPGLTLQSLQFHEGALSLNLTGTDLQALENLRIWFASHRDAVLEVGPTNAGPQGVQMQVTLTLA
jgi:general secretion pathway protein L